MLLKMCHNLKVVNYIKEKYRIQQSWFCRCRDNPAPDYHHFHKIFRLRPIDHVAQYGLNKEIKILKNIICTSWKFIIISRDTIWSSHFPLPPPPPPRITDLTLVVESNGRCDRTVLFPLNSIWSMDINFHFTTLPCRRLFTFKSTYIQIILP